MNPAILQDFSRRVREQLFGHILPFWCGPALDHEQGGWMAWLSNDLTPNRTQPKGLIVNSRILWAFSAVHRVRPEALYREMADRAFDIVLNRFWDAQHGGAFWQLDGDGRVLDNSKKTYGQAFYIYALAEYHQAFGPADYLSAGRPGNRDGGGTEAAGTDGPTTTASALTRALELFELIERHTHDPEHGGYLEVCQRDWSEATDVRLSAKDMNEKKSMNNQLHVLEAYTNLYRGCKAAGYFRTHSPCAAGSLPAEQAGSPAGKLPAARSGSGEHLRIEKRLRELIALFQQHILDGRTHHLHHFFDERWQVRSDTYTFGHDIEASWLLCEAAAVLGDEALLAQVRAVALQMAEAVLTQGLAHDGGLCYEGEAGRVIDSRKECWPQAEAVVGFLNAFQLSKDERYLSAARRVWHFIEQHLVDRVHGEWFWRINGDDRPDAKLPKVSEWKGPYHGTRACLEAMRRLELIGKL